MGEKDEKPQDDDTEGQGKRSVSAEGTEEENAEGQLFKRGLSPEGTEEENAEGQGKKQLATNSTDPRSTIA